MDEPLFENLRAELDFLHRRELESLMRVGELDLPGDLDGWDGYPAARERFYGLAKNAGAADLIVLSGDTHGYWANALFDDNGSPVGVELGTTGISSPRFLMDYGSDATARWSPPTTARSCGPRVAIAASFGSISLIKAHVPISSLSITWTRGITNHES